MVWIRLSGGRKAGERKPGVEKDYAAEDIVELIGKRLLALITLPMTIQPRATHRGRARCSSGLKAPMIIWRGVKEWSQQGGEE